MTSFRSIRYGSNARTLDVQLLAPICGVPNSTGKPRLTLALSLYDRHFPFFDGTVAVEDVDLRVLAVGEADRLRDGGRRHHRMLIDLEFDACEVSLSSYIIARQKGFPVIAIAVFPRRLFTHSNIWVNNRSGIREPKELVGRKVGVISLQTTLSVQAKGDLQAEYGVPWREIEWHVAAQEPIEFAAPRSARCCVYVPGDCTPGVTECALST